MLLVGIALGALVASGTARAQEVSRGAQPTPDSVEELGGALQEAFEEDRRVVGLFPRLTRAMGKLPPFLRDTEVTFRARTYYFDRWNEDETRAQAWTLGGALVYRSGWLKDTFAIGAALYLGVFGSGISFVLYFHLLARISALTMSLITFITPIIALTLGAFFDYEVLGPRAWLGTGMVLGGVLLAAIRSTTSSQD